MRRKGLFHPVVLGFLQAGGFLALWLAATGLLFALVWGATHSYEPSEYLVFADGQPVRQMRIDRYQVEYRDLQGNPAPPAVAEKAMVYGTPLPARPPEPEPHAPGSWEGCIRPFSDGHKPAVFWYLISDGGRRPRSYFVGYDSYSNARVGYLGTAGFRAEPVPPEEYVPFYGDVSTAGVLSLQQRPHDRVDYPFWIDARPAPPGSVGFADVYLLGHDHKLYHADLRRRTLDVILDDPGLLSLQTYNYGGISERGAPCHLLARTETAVLILDDRGSLLQRYPIPEPLRGQEILFVQTKKDEAVMYKVDLFRGITPREGPRKFHMWWVGPQGPMRQAEGELAGGKESAPPLMFGVFCPAPLVLALFEGTFLPWVQMSAGEAAGYSAALGQTLRAYYSSLVFAVVVAAALAVLCYRREVLYGGSRAERVAWVLFVLALGLPGWLAYRFGRSWPRLERCPTCGTVVPADREQCSRCTAEFPRPALKGTEVFA
jgi:hypothetical protein